MTTSERQALCFLAGVAVLGAGVRIWKGAGEGEPVPPAAERALASQMAAAESAAVARIEQERERAERRASGIGSRGGRSRAGNGSKERGAPAKQAVPPQPVDLDTAGEAELDLLPRIGPVLASRIVANRDSLGAFGSLEELQRVKGIGPALARGLEGRVTFSGTPRPNRAVWSSSRALPGTGAPSARKRSRP